MAAALPYHEPSALTILILSSFLLVSNTLNFLLDKAIFCGLIGQMLVGIAWGVPGGNLLGPDVENAIVQFGYLGLILLVYEGENLTAMLNSYAKPLRVAFRPPSQQ